MMHTNSALQRQVNHYAAVRARIDAAGRKYKKSKMSARDEAPKRIGVVLGVIPTWKREETRFDCHKPMPSEYKFRLPIDEWIAKRCGELDISVEEIKSTNKKREYAYKRMQIYYEIKNEYPHLSLPTIGRLIGNRDHTTVLHGIRKWEQMKNES